MTDEEICKAIRKHRRVNKGWPDSPTYGLMYYLVDSDELMVEVYDDYKRNHYTTFGQPAVCIDRELGDRGLPMTLKNVKMIIDEQLDGDYSYWSYSPDYNPYN